MPEPVEAFQERARRWLEPIPGGAPGGVSARLEPAYEKLASEVGRLDTAAGGEVDWERVAAGADELLRARTKDLTVAAYLSRALLSTEGVAGLGTGLHLFTELMERYWDTAFPDPKRLRARANAAQWMVEKGIAGLGLLDPEKLDPEVVAAVGGAARQLGDAVRARLGSAAPAIGPLLELLERMRLTAEASRPPAPATPGQEAAPAEAPPPPSALSAAAVVGSAAPSLPQPAPAPPGSAQDLVEYLRGVGGALASTAAVVRQADATDPLGYRLLRTGLWLHLVQPPPAAGGKTSVPPPPEALRSSLALMAQHQRWAALLDEAESALIQHRFWLDPHRVSARALAGLGPGSARAAEAVAAELRGLLVRMPGLPGLTFSDGTPLADAETRAWIEEAITPAQRAAPAAVSVAAELPEAALSEAQGLLVAGRVGEGLTAFTSLVSAQPSGRPRFLARLALARAAAAAGLHPVAKGLFEGLVAEVEQHGLDEWEPPLAVECLKGFLTAARTLAKDPRADGPELTSRYQRLCRLDPAAAHEVWP